MRIRFLQTDYVIIHRQIHIGGRDHRVAKFGIVDQAIRNPSGVAVGEQRKDKAKAKQPLATKQINKCNAQDT